MAIIARTLAGIKSDPLSLIGGADRINTLFAQAGHVWRDRLLDPVEPGIESGARAGEEKAQSARRIRGHRNGPMPRLTVER